MNKHKLIYVDDENINLELFSYNLSGKYEVYTAESGMEGLHYLEKHPDIEVIISDMKMPKMNGIEFIKKAIKLLPAVKCFILTGYDINPEIRDALENKIILNCFFKPFEYEKIISGIDNAINGRNKA